MKDEISFHQILIRFQEPDKFTGDHVTRLAEFTYYVGLINANNPIDTINVDIRSYGFDHERVQEELNRFRENVSLALEARCKLDLHSITYSSNDVVGRMANEPIRDVTYTLEILK